MRESGILLPVSALPSKHGIGKLGQAAFDFVDFLRGAGCHYWQVLPLTQTSYGDSPYQSPSCFAGNPYLIDFDLLAERGWLRPSDYDGLQWGSDALSECDAGSAHCLPEFHEAHPRRFPEILHGAEGVAE